MAFADKAANTRRAFTIIDKETGQIAGSSSMEIFPIMIWGSRSAGAGWEKISEVRE